MLIRIPNTASTDVLISHTGLTGRSRGDGQERQRFTPREERGGGGRGGGVRFGEQGSWNRIPLVYFKNI